MKDALSMKLTIEELNLILEGLGAMPYYRVHELIHNIHSQAQQQVNTKNSQRAVGSDAASATAHAGNGVAVD